jgi:mgtE-like transporter
VPPFLEDSGSLGAILSARVSTKLHLGLVEPSRSLLRTVGDDVLLIYVYAVPVFFFLAVSASIAAGIAGLRSPGFPEILALSMIAGFLATTCSVVIGYYGALAAYRLGFDPDSHGVPIVTSSLDLLGAVSLILTIVMLGLA